jgi:hypothetical protein
VSADDVPGVFTLAGQESKKLDKEAKETKVPVPRRVAASCLT